MSSATKKTPAARTQNKNGGRSLVGKNPMSPIQGADLVREVVDRLRDYIMRGEIEAGGVLPSEGDLTETFGVSRTVVREAMRILRAQGLVEISQGKRPRVKAADSQATIDSLDIMLSRCDASLEHLTELRRPLEVEIAILAAERATPAQLAALAAANAALRDAKTLSDQVSADIQFHRVLAEATGNPLFVLFLETVAQLLRESRRRTISQSGVETALSEHERILATIAAHDPAAARQAMLTHMRLIERDLKKSGNALRNR